MPDVPHETVARGIEDVMDRNGQFDHTESRAKMPASRTDGRYHFGAQFISNLAQVGGGKPAKCGGCCDSVKQGRVRKSRHIAF